MHPDTTPTGTPPGPQHLSPTPAIDSDHPTERAFADAHAQGADARECGVSLYLAVRDRLRYDPYRIDLSLSGMRASSALAQGAGWCVPKAVALAAVARAAGIPARLGFADVRNHLSTERMRETMKTDLFIWHGYTDIWIEGGWVKATPAFNIGLCERFGLLPLEFDGRNDSIYHPFDRAGNRHMEYVRQRGTFDDLPLEQIVADFQDVYGSWMTDPAALQSASFQQDVEKETR